MKEILLNPQLWSATLAMATPLALPALGGTFSERSGVVNIAMEGIMLIAAFFAVLFAHLTGSAWLGLLGAVIVGMIVAVIFAWAAVTLTADQVILGMAINIFASGFTAYLLNTIFGFSGTPTDTPMLPNINIPVIKNIPFVGQILSGNSVIVYLMIILIFASDYFLFHTNLGLRIRAVGENPEAAETAGINVIKLRYLGVTLSGLFSAIGGAYLSIGLLNSFSTDMSSGRGYIALAAMIFGKWTPFGSFGAALLFGFATALSMQLQNSALSKNIIMMLPYILTVLALVGVGGKSVSPAADGVPYTPKK
ncbi:MULTISPECIES: ABC transporter permease [Thermoanaerobacterium]|uniref:ABC-type transporter, integral membrane subunit n=1 Tax=Thermoanaerobacterium xylanolyticum (strain ATCC 49914 / DSM 7097 / LX-11) TaxID=858215 RepID=F6BJK9_THEXL|nr:ABC transporter permease [Thermoanaerobacterium xylanolyticum]AEF17955.1 ABC-type transporter, integral membrane subunit [Thermoanaerobacterium xylanolyticum LX-11]